MDYAVYLHGGEARLAEVHQCRGGLGLGCIAVAAGLFTYDIQKCCGLNHDVRRIGVNNQRNSRGVRLRYVFPHNICLNLSNSSDPRARRSPSAGLLS